jgi:hypothetical protein
MEGVVPVQTPLRPTTDPATTHQTAASTPSTPRSVGAQRVGVPRVGAQSSTSSTRSTPPSAETPGAEEDDSGQADISNGQYTNEAILPCSVQVLDAPVFVQGPDVAKRHSSWADWASYLADYSTQTRQIIRVLNTVGCKLRNSPLHSTEAAREGIVVPCVPEEWKYYQRTYICTHGWPTKDRNTGKRPKHSFAAAAAPSASPSSSSRTVTGCSG